MPFLFLKREFVSRELYNSTQLKKLNPLRSHVIWHINHKTLSSCDDLFDIPTRCENEIVNTSNFITFSTLSIFVNYRQCLIILKRDLTCSKVFVLNLALG